MGWFFSYAHTEKKHVVEDITSNFGSSNPTIRCLAHSVVGNVLWSVWEVDTPEKAERFIRCDLLRYDRNDQCWGYKDMDEGMHPYYYSCPLRFLSMAPVACQAWRDNVIKYHAAQKDKRAKRASIQVGQTWKLRAGCTPTQVKIVSVKPLRGIANGVRYQIRSTYLDCQIEG